MDLRGGGLIEFYVMRRVFLDFNLVLVDGDLFHVLEEGIFLEILMFKLVFGRITVYYMYNLLFAYVFTMSSWFTVCFGEFSAYLFKIYFNYEFVEKLESSFGWSSFCWIWLFCCLFEYFKRISGPPSLFLSFSLLMECCTYIHIYNL